MHVATSMRVAALVAAFALAAGACGGSGTTKAAKPTAAVATTTTDPQQAQRAAVLQAWRDYWSLYVELGREGRTFDAHLTDLATGRALAQSQAALQQRYLQGQVYRGTYDLDPIVLALTADHASVRDCVGDHTEIYNTRTSTVDKPADANRSVHSGELVIEGGRWKLSSIDNGGPCQ